MLKKIVFALLILFGISILTQCAEKKDGTKREKPAQVRSTTEVTKSIASKAVEISPERLAKAESILAATTPEELSKLDGKQLFKVHCAICHGFKGDMKINGAKDLSISKISLTAAVAQVYHGQGLMTPYKGVLSDAEIVAVSTYSEQLRK